MAAAIIPKPKLSQGTIVVGALAGAWILWLAAQNKLLVYWLILMGQGGALSAADAASSAASAAGAAFSGGTAAPAGGTGPDTTTHGWGVAGGPSTGNVTTVTGTPGASVTTTVTPTSGILSSFATPDTATVGDIVTGGY